LPFQNRKIPLTPGGNPGAWPEPAEMPWLPRFESPLPRRASSFQVPHLRIAGILIAQVLNVIERFGPMLLLNQPVPPGYIPVDPALQDPPEPALQRGKTQVPGAASEIPGGLQAGWSGA